eukprot:CAMPEP_0172176686 /NCGR_PEP_ID=MMETSP1050-20130122/14968_1 /TAXON_ID=233186 /ORGANISM="Cryptomonas curvata, Strain CCAP979/52" /LENGTH=355 /DNA_ID=CAMNT_0012849021 /DNA_START=134 /DNA_END=1198 /DNA_ORIENTATION=-
MPRVCTNLTITAVTALFFIVAIYKLNPEWGRQGSHAVGTRVHYLPAQTTALIGLSCCEPSICSKYALDACTRARRQRKLASRSDGTESNSDDGGDDFLQSAVAALSSQPRAEFHGGGAERNSIPVMDHVAGSRNSRFTGGTYGGNGGGSYGGSGGGDEGNDGTVHRGAAAAAAALGLHLVGASAPSMRSYFARQRESMAQEREQSSSGYGAPPPTVGLIEPHRNRHAGAEAAAAAFGIHLSNLPSNGAANVPDDSGGAREQYAVTGGGTGLGTRAGQAAAARTQSLLQLSADTQFTRASGEPDRLRDLHSAAPSDGLLTAPLAAAEDLWAGALRAAAAAPASKSPSNPARTGTGG